MLRMAAQQGKKTVLYLFRNDLRVHDNQCLNWAHQNGDHIIPLYCFQPEHFATTHNFNFRRCGKQRAKFLVESVTDLRSNLKKLGSNLVVRRESPISAVSDLIELCSSGNAPIHSVVYHREVTKEETEQEDELVKICRQRNIHVEPFWGSTLFHVDDLPYKRPSDYPDVYTQFRKGVESRSSVRDIIHTPDALKSLPPINGGKLGDMPSLKDLGFESDTADTDARSAFAFKGGESSALQRLNEYLWGTGAVATYKETRNGLVGLDYSTKFSPWLANGSISPRRIFHEVKRYEQSEVANQSTYWVIFELIWRDFFRYVSHKFGDRIFLLTGIRDKHLPWKQDKEAFQKWAHGDTGVPFVDANMRELLHTGWMSNRGRQNVASFLVKDLGIDWRMGAEWFESLLLDHDPCSNYGNWNYSAGIGCDPREDRKFNIIKQALDYDKEGTFVKMWIPELGKVPSDKVHFPWRNEGEMKCYDVELGSDYPQPIVVAPEWNKFLGYYNAGMGSSRGGKGGRGGGRGGGKMGSKGHGKGNYGKGQGPGIDFYFKGGSGKK